MKKLLLLMLGVLIALPTIARDFTYTYEGQTLTYTVIDEEAKTVSVATKDRTISGDLIIPATVKDGDTEYTVTSIGERAFSGCTGLTSVTIPNSVTSIGERAFFSCDGLTKAEFASVEALCSIKFGNRLSNPLYRASHLYIDGKEVTDLVIPETVTTIGAFTFFRCSGLTSVTIPESVTSIGEEAFNDCSGLTSVTIPNSVTSIGKLAFSGCTGLTKAEFASVESLCSIKFGIGSNPLSSAHHLYIDGKEVTDLVIPETVTTIGEYAFSGCSGLTSVTIPNSVTSIGDSAFSDCSGLTSVSIPNTVTSIGAFTFSRCSGLTTVTIPNSVTSIGDWAFYGCSGLTSVYYGADKPISGSFDIFSNPTYEQAFLYMSEKGIEIGKTVDPWKNFKNIETHEFNGVEDVAADFEANEPYDVYNLSGVWVGDSLEGLTHGFYIVRQGNVAKKIAIK